MRTKHKSITEQSWFSPYLLDFVLCYVITNVSHIQRSNTLVFRRSDLRHLTVSIQQLSGYRIILTVESVLHILISQGIIWICRSVMSVQI